MESFYKISAFLKRSWFFWFIFCFGLNILSVSVNGAYAISSENVVETVLFGNMVDDGSGCGVYAFVHLIINIFSAGVGILGLIGIVVTGVSFMTASGNPEQTKKARRRFFEVLIGLILYALLYAGAQWLLPGGSLNTSSECSTISDEELAKIKEEEREKRDGKNGKEGKDGKLDGTTSYTKKINSKPFKLKVSGGSKKIKYKSSNKRIAYVTSKGMVYPNDVGSATVTVSSGSEKIKVKIKIKTRTSKPKVAEVPAGDVIVQSYRQGGTYYSYDYVFRYKNPVRAEKAADNAIVTANNHHVIGHTGDNNDFTKKLKKAKWNPAKIKTTANTACSQFVLAMAESVGIKRGDVRWANRDAPGAASALKKNKNFYTLTNSKYTRSWKRLRRGDILIDATGSAHAVMVAK